MSTCYNKTMYNQWLEMKKESEVVARGRVIRLYKEKSRKVLLIHSTIRYRVIIEESNEHYGEFAGRNYVGAIIAFKGKADKSKEDIKLVYLVDFMVVSHSRQNAEQLLLSTAKNYMKQGNYMYHIKMCNDINTIAFIKVKNRILSNLRLKLSDLGFCECKIPILQRSYYGGGAMPFKTYVNYAHKDYYLKPNSQIPFLLHLAGGMEKVYEISDYFRNGGTDSLHSVPYCALELYCAFMDYDDIIALSCVLFNDIMNSIAECVEALRSNDNNLTSDIKTVIDFSELVYNKCGIKIDEVSIQELKYLIEGKNPQNSYENINWIYKWLKKDLIKDLKGPVIIKNLPSGNSPFIRKTYERPYLLKRGYIVYKGSNIIEFFEGITEEYEEVLTELKLQNIFCGRRTGDTTRDFRALRHAFLLGIPPYSAITISLDRVVALALETSVSEYNMLL